MKTPGSLWDRASRGLWSLFPLNGAGGLGGEVEEDAVDAVDFGGDAVGDFVEHCVGDFFDGGGHGVGGVDGTDDGRPAFIAAFVLDADALDVGDGDEVLPDLAGEACVVEFFTQDCICFTQCVQAVAGDGTEATDTETGAGERLTVNHSMRQAECLTDDTDFVLEQQLDRLDELHSHFFGQTADVVVGLDCLFAFSLFDAFEDIGINGALCKEADAVEFGGFFVENLDEFGTDDLSLLFGIGDTCKQVKEAVGGIDVNKVCIQTVLENFDYVFAFAFAHETVVDVHADELFADGFDEQCGDNGTVDTAGECQKHLLVTNLRTDSGDLFVDELRGKFGGGDAGHGFGTKIVAHENSSCMMKIFKQVKGAYKNARADRHRRQKRPLPPTRIDIVGVFLLNRGIIHPKKTECKKKIEEIEDFFENEQR